MSPYQPQSLLAAAVAIATGLVALWSVGGLPLAFAGAALADMALTAFGRRNEQRRIEIKADNDRA